MSDIIERLLAEVATLRNANSRITNDSEIACQLRAMNERRIALHEEAAAEIEKLRKTPSTT